MRSLMTSMTFALSAVLLLTIACDDVSSGETTIACPSEDGPFTLADSRVTGTMSFEPPADPLGRGDSLVVTGTAFHEDELAIREVRVAGVSATKSQFNFGQWSATVPYESVVTAGPTSAESQVSFEAVAIDACGNRYPFALAVVTVDPSPNVDVDVLSIDIEYPAERTFIPATGAVPAIITITGSGHAAGAVVSVSADSGDLRGVDEQGQVVLAAPFGETDVATATLVFSSSEAGTATIAATVEDKLAVGLVRVVGPPTLAPRRATLVPGSSVEVDVAGATDIRCTASPNEDLTVTHFDAPLSNDPMTIELDEGNRRVLVVEAAAEPLGAEVEVVVSCTDDFGQVGGGRYRLGAGSDTGGGEEPLPEDF